MSETLSAKKTSAPLTGGATVSVASKLSFDLTLRLYDFVTKSEPVLGGGMREAKMAVLRHSAQPVIVKGNSYSKHLGDNGEQIMGGYAITHGVPKAFWDEWLSQNESLNYVVNGLLFASSDIPSLNSETTEKMSLKSGLERLDPSDLPKNIVQPRTRS